MPQYDAFLSYRRSDGARVARWLRRELQNFRPPKSLRARVGKRLRIYVDTAYERATADFYESEIHPALMASRFLCIVVTPDMLVRRKKGQDWVLREIADFRSGPHGRNIIVVRGGGEFDDPLPGDLLEDYPNLEVVDLRGAGRWNLANSFRMGRLLSEKLKIIAALHDIAPADMPALRQEQERRQQALIGLAAGAAASVVAAVSALSVYALQSAWRAEQALLRSQHATSRLVSTVSTSIPDNGRSDGPRALAMAVSCDLFDQLTQDHRGRAAPNIDVVCALERAAAFERHAEKAKARASFEFATAHATENLGAMKEADAKAVQHEARLALAQFYTRIGEGDLALDLAGRMLADATAPMTLNQSLDTDGRESALDRAIESGLLRAQMRDKRGDPTAAIADYKDVLRFAASRARVREQTQASLPQARRNAAVARGFEFQATVHSHIANLLRKTRPGAAVAEFQTAIGLIRQAEKQDTATLQRDLKIADLNFRILRLEPFEGWQSARARSRAEIERRLNRVWKADDASGAERRKAKRLWFQARKISGDQTTTNRRNSAAQGN